MERRIVCNTVGSNARFFLVHHVYNRAFLVVVVALGLLSLVVYFISCCFAGVGSEKDRGVG